MSAVLSVVALQSIPIDSARLPAVYERAVLALTDCSRIDECQQWADKAEALASYAKQAKDEQLRKMADRIQGRAIARCGELLKQIPPAANQHDAESRAQDGTVPRTRTEAATEAGMSERQRKTALRVATFAEQQPEEFERQIESDRPPTVTQLAEQGRQSRPKPLVDLGEIAPADYARATEAQGALRRFAEYCGAHDPIRIARAFKSHEIASLRQYVSSVDAWLDRFVTNLPE